MSWTTVQNVYASLYLKVKISYSTIVMDDVVKQWDWGPIHKIFTILNKGFFELFEAVEDNNPCSQINCKNVSILLSKLWEKNKFE